MNAPRNEGLRIGDMLVYTGWLPWVDTIFVHHKDSVAIYLGQTIEQKCVHCGKDAASLWVGDPCPDQMPHRFDYKEKHAIFHPILGFRVLDDLVNWRLHSCKITVPAGSLT